MAATRTMLSHALLLLSVLAAHEAAGLRLGAPLGRSRLALAPQPPAPAPRLPRALLAVAAAAAAPAVALADAADAAAAAAPASRSGLLALPPDSLIIGTVVVLLLGIAALQFSLGDVLNEVDNLPPSMGSQAKKERIRQGGFLKTPEQRPRM